MNAMWLHADLDEAAKYHPTAYHKLILEATQMLSTALHENGLGELAPYRKTHTNHPMTRWATESFHNWFLLRDYAQALHKSYYGYTFHDISQMGEYEYEHKKDNGDLHKSFCKLAQIPVKPVAIIMPDVGMTARPKCTGDYEPSSPLLSVEEAYREYVRDVKQPQDWFEWREVPDWA